MKSYMTIVPIIPSLLLAFSSENHQPQASSVFKYSMSAESVPFCSAVQ